jgi:RNA polymerase-binding protein DksA
VAKKAAPKATPARGGKAKSGASRAGSIQKSVKSKRSSNRSNGEKTAGEKVGSARGAVAPTRSSSLPKLARRADKNSATKFPNNLPVPPPPVPTDGKPKKNQAGLNTRELEHFRELLLAKRRELVGDMNSMETEALRSTTGSNLSTLPLHMADMGTDNYEQEFTLGLVEKDRNLLREINQALAKIQNGTYGICEGTAKPIAKVRLEAQPWAKYSVEYARLLERGLVRR